jgi:glycosyltransferase involved in cell wall biosynthesis
LRLAVLGTVASHKGAHLVIDALRLAKLTPVCLALWGRIDDTRYATELRRRAAEVPGLTLELHGEYAPNELPDALGGIDAVLVPSQVREASPLVPREALAYRVPVLVARIGGLPEAIVEGHNGMTFNPFDPGELAVLLRRLVDEPGLLESLTRGATSSDVRTTAESAGEMRALFVAALEARNN